VVNFPNFPQPGGFTPPGLPPENYWIAIGFKLLFVGLIFLSLFIIFFQFSFFKEMGNGCDRVPERECRDQFGQVRLRTTTTEELVPRQSDHIESTGSIFGQLPRGLLLNRRGDSFWLQRMDVLLEANPGAKVFNKKYAKTSKLLKNSIDVFSSYTGQIHAKVVCNVSEACSRADCCNY
jgi:hypothetical protein